MFEEIHTKLIERLNDPVLGYTGIFQNQIVYANDDANGRDIKDGFIFFDIIVNGSGLQSINASNSRHRATGVIEIGVHIPYNTMVGTALEEADKLADVFRSKNFKGILCFSPSIDNGRNIEYSKSKYFRVDLYIPFKYDKDFNA